MYSYLSKVLPSRLLYHTPNDQSELHYSIQLYIAMSISAVCANFSLKLPLLFVFALTVIIVVVIVAYLFISICHVQISCTAVIRPSVLVVQ